MKRRDLSAKQLGGKEASETVSKAGQPDGSARKHPPAPFTWTGFLLHRVHELARKLYETRMATIGLRSHQVGILQLLAAEGPMVQARLSDKLGVDKAAIVFSLNELESAALVERKNHPDDERAFLVHLRPLGLERLQTAERLNNAVSEELFHALSAGEQETLRGLLKKVADAHGEINKS